MIKKNSKRMTKKELVLQISNRTGIENIFIESTIESFMEIIMESLSNGENVSLRGFGSFIVKRRAEKKGRNIFKKETIIIPAHNVPLFKPSQKFITEIKNKVK